MAATYVEHFVVATPDDLDELELALCEGGLTAVRVEIPEDATALLSAREFRRVVTTARSAGTELEFVTDDLMRRELARIVGAQLVEQEDAPTTSSNSVSSSDDLTHRIDQRVVDHSGSDDDTFRLWQPGSQAGHWDEPEHTDASYSFVITPPSRGNVVIEEAAAGRHERHRVDIPTFEEWEQIRPLREQTRPQPKRRPIRAVASQCMVVAVLAIAGLLAMFIAPTATITVTPIVTPLSVNLTYGVATPGSNWDVSIEPTPLDTTLTFTSSAATTGERFEPDASAAGVLQLTNASTEELVIAAGTSFVSNDGIEVLSNEEVAVPAADPYSSLTFGSATVTVHSAVAGPDGNLDAQSVFGQLENGVFFVNREPLTGGTMKRIATVTQADLDALAQSARNDLAARSATALDALIPVGQQLVPNSVVTDEIAVSFDHPLGSDAVAVTVQGTQRVAGSTFDPNAAHELASAEASGRLKSLAGSDARLIDESVQVLDPQPIAESGGTGFTLVARATSEAVIDTETLDGVRSALAGKGQDDALARIRDLPGVADASIDVRRSWLGQSLPRLKSHITVVIRNVPDIEVSTSDAEALRTQAPSSGSTATWP